MEIPGQINLFEFLAENCKDMPESKVNIEGVININKFTDFTVQSTYKDIFLIINMLDDYIKFLTQREKIDHYTNYMIQQFERISRELSEQIGLDKEKMYKRCRKKIESEKDGVGEEAMILAFYKKN